MKNKIIVDFMDFHRLWFGSRCRNIRLELTEIFYNRTFSYWVCKMQEIQTFSKCFLHVFLHHSIELDELITKNYFLALANISFQSKNSKYSKSIVIREKHIFSRNIQNFLLHYFYQLLKIIFQIQHQKLNRNKLLNRL